MNKLILDSVIEQAIKDCIENVSSVIASKYDSYGANDVYEIEYKSHVDNLTLDKISDIEKQLLKNV